MVPDKKPSAVSANRAGPINNTAKKIVKFLTAHFKRKDASDVEIQLLRDPDAWSIPVTKRDNFQKIAKQAMKKEGVSEFGVQYKICIKQQ